MLKDRGVSHVFGIPGVHNQEMYRGIEEAGLVHVLARHEQGAGFMADGYARATGKPGVAYVITGPGLCNIMTPMGQAYSDSVPMLVISSCLDETAATRGQLHQVLDQRAAGACVSDWSEEARSAEAAYALVDRALTEFKTKRKRTKSISVPIAQLQGVAARFPVAPDVGDRVSPLQAGDVVAIQTLVNAAHKPLIILGGGVKDGSAAEAFLAASKAASFTTYAGRGLVAGDSPLHFGSMLGRPGSADILEQSDLVIAIGTELAEVDLWRDQLGHNAPLVRVDIDPEILSDRHRPDHQVMYDGDAFLADLRDLGVAREGSGWSAADVAATRAQWRAEIDAERPGILPAVDALKDCLPDGTMIYSDMCQFAYAAKEVWDMDRPGHWHHPTGFGTLGYATPAAIGGAVARPGQPTMAIIGDYGFQYTVAEMATAVELQLPLVIFLWDNGKLGEIEDSMVRAQIAPNAVIQRNPDFVKLAEAYGARSAQPQGLDEMQAAVRAAFEADGPTVIRVTSDIVA